MMEGPAPHAAVVEALARWEGAPVMVRVVAAEQNELVGIFAGRLQGLSNEKSGALFWPLESSALPRDAERPGIYLHPGSFERAEIHRGDFVIEYDQAGVTVNIRRLAG